MNELKKVKEQIVKDYLNEINNQAKVNANEIIKKLVKPKKVINDE